MGMNRRDFVWRSASGLLAAGGRGVFAAEAREDVEDPSTAARRRTVLQDMGAWIAAMRYEDLPAATVSKAKYLLLDTFGCALGAVDARPVRAAREVVRARGGNPQATVIGAALKTSCDEAAFLNAMQIRYLDFNDYAAFGDPHHPSMNLAPAMAVAELRNLSGQDLILGVTVGSEVSIRMRDASTQRGFDGPSVVTQYGSAGCAARLLGLDADGIANALAVAASNAITLSEVRSGVELTSAKGTAEALAVRSGTFAALLARAGVDYPLTIMDGKSSYKSLVSDGLKEDILRARSGDYQIMKSCVKMWPSIGTSQAPIAAALQIRAPGVRADDIQALTLRLSDFGYDQQLGFLQHEITTREHADHSVPYLVARAFIDGDVRTGDFEERRYRDPVALAFMKKIRVEKDASLTTSGDLLGCRLRATLIDGSIREADMPHAPGGVQNPASEEQLLHKFSILADSVLGAAGARRAAEVILAIDGARNLGELVGALTPAHRA